MKHFNQLEPGEEFKFSNDETTPHRALVNIHKSKVFWEYMPSTGVIFDPRSNPLVITKHTKTIETWE